METLVHVGLTNGLFAAMLALVVAIVTLFCRRRPAVVHGLWILVLVKFLVPSFYPIEVPGWRVWPAPVTRPEPVLSNQDRSSSGWHARAQGHFAANQRPDTGPERAKAEKSPGPRAWHTAIPVASEEISGEPSGIGSRPAEVMEIGPDDVIESPVLPAAEISQLPESELWWELVVGIVWLTGSITWIVVAGIRIVRFRQLLNLARPADPKIHDRVQKLARRIGLSICPEVSLVSAPIAPLLWALGRSPRLLIPRQLWERLSEEQRDTLLVHELAHLGRRDHWVRWLEMVVLALYWWHPGVWWARQQLRAVEEECCDAWVLWALPNANQDYAIALVETLAFLSQSQPVLPMGASGIEPMRFLKRRLAMIVRGQTPRAMSRWAFWAVVGLGAVLLPLLPIPAQQPPSNEGQDKTIQPSPAQDSAPRPTEQRARDVAPGQPLHLDQIQIGNAVSGYRSKDVGLSSESQLTGTAPMRVDRWEQIEAAKDQVELMEAKRSIKRAEVNELEMRIRQAQRNQSRMEELFKKGVIQESALSAARNEAELLPTQLPIKQAELAEAEILLKQASRRLQRLEAGPAASESSEAGISGRALPSTGHLGKMGSGLPAPGGGRQSSGAGLGIGGRGLPEGAAASPMGMMGGAGGPPASGKLGGSRSMIMPGASSAPGMMGGKGMLGTSASKGMIGGGQPGPQTTENEAPEDVQGVVLQADAKTGLATISIGMDSGITSGNKLEVYRLKPNPIYLGKIEILEAQAHRAVGRLADGARWGALEKGDLVAGKVTGKVTGNAGGMTAREAQSPRWADRLFAEKSKDFGSVPRGKKVAHQFQLTNNLEMPIHIARLRTSSAFVTPQLVVRGHDVGGAPAVLNDSWIVPHQSATIYVEMVGQGLPGENMAHVYVQFDQPSPAEVCLQLRSRNQDPVTADSAQGEVWESKRKVKELEDKVDDLMKQIDALRDELKQRPGKSTSGAPPTPNDEKGTDPASP